MNKTTTRMVIRLTAAVFLAGVLAPVFASAQAGQATPPPAKKPAARMIAREALDLTPEQEKALQEFRNVRTEEARAFREEMMKIRGELGELAKDPQANEAKINALVDKKAKLQAEREKAGFKNRIARDKIFTPEQLEKMKAFRGRLMGRPGMAWRGRMAFGSGPFRGPGPRRFWGPGFGFRRMGPFRPFSHRFFPRWRWRW